MTQDGSTAQLSEDQLQSQRETLRRGLAWSNAAAVFVLIGSIVLSLAAIFYAQRAQRNFHLAQQATIQAEEELWKAESARAQATRRSGLAGSRFESLAAIRNAVKIRPSLDLRNEAIAALALSDVRPTALWRDLPPQTHLARLTSELDHYALVTDAGKISVRDMASDETLVEFAGGGPLMNVQFSPNDQFLLARFYNGDLSVWDWRRSTLVLKTNFASGGAGCFIPQRSVQTAGLSLSPKLTNQFICWNWTRDVTSNCCSFPSGRGCTVFIRRMECWRRRSETQCS